MDFVNKKLTDTGTRYQHYRDLVGTFEDGIIAIQRQQYMRPSDPLLLAKLEAAMELTQRIIDSMSDAKDLNLEVKELIKEIPSDPHKINGGRGTELNGN